MADNASAISSSRPPSPEDFEHPAPLELSQHLHRASAGTPAQFRFQWDGVSRRQGPPSVSEATESRADTFDLAFRNQQDMAAVVNTLSASSGSLPQTWSSTHNGFNAISNVLSNPHSKPAPLKSSRAPLPSSTSPDLPRIRRKDFDGYLKTIGPEWERFHSSLRVDSAGGSAPESRDEYSRHYADEQATPRQSLATRILETPTLSSTPLVPSPSSSLDLVPSIYFNHEFHLTDPTTFALVMEQRDDDDRARRLGMEDDEAATGQELQDRLSQYLDIVEQHLTREISSRSNSFFAALSNLQSLQAEGGECLTRIGRLRRQLQDVDDKQAKKGLEITRLLKKQENLEVVQDGIREIQGVGESIGLIKNLVGAAEYFEALGMIEEIEGMFDQTNHPPTTTPALAEASQPKLLLPFSSVAALSNLPSHLRNLSTTISSSLSADLVAILKADLTREREYVPIKDDQPASTSADIIDPMLKDRISPLLQGLSGTGGVEAAVTAYRHIALAEIRAVIRNYLPSTAWDDEDVSALDPDADSLANSGGRDLKSMSHVDFLQLIKSIYTTLLQRITTVSSHVACISSIISSFPSSTTEPTIPQETPPALSDLLSSVTELANTRSSKFLALRSSENAQLPLPSFLEFFTESWNFVVRCEVIARRMIVGLRGVVVGQAKAFLQYFHQSRISDSARFVEEEVWAQVEVSKEAQRCVDIVVDAAMTDPKELLVTGPPGTGGGINGNFPHVNGTKSPASPTRTTNAKLLLIEERTYFVVGATLQVLELLVDYLKIIVNLPLLTTDAMSRTIEFLKAFNSRTCQVVLGAGAMRSAGLKNITAKHLALASQSLSVMIALIPYIRETFRRHLNPKQAVMLVEFDKLKRDYQEHQNEIHSKLIAIMGDRLSVHCRTLSEIRWDQSPSSASRSATGAPNQYMEVLVKETVTLHKVLSKYLAQPAVELIMSQVFAAINHRLAEEYQNVELPNQEAKTRLLQDARYLNEKFSALNGVTPPSAMLETVVMEKQLPRRGSPFPTRRVSAFGMQSGTPASGASTSHPSTPRESGEFRAEGTLLSPNQNGLRTSPAMTRRDQGSSSRPTSPSPPMSPPTGGLLGNTPSISLSSSLMTSRNHSQNPIQQHLPTSPLVNEVVEPSESLGAVIASSDLEGSGESLGLGLRTSQNMRKSPLDSEQDEVPNGDTRG